MVSCGAPSGLSPPPGVSVDAGGARRAGTGLRYQLDGIRLLSSRAKWSQGAAWARCTSSKKPLSAAGKKSFISRVCTNRSSAVPICGPSKLLTSPPQIADIDRHEFVCYARVRAQQAGDTRSAFCGLALIRRVIAVPVVRCHRHLVPPGAVPVVSIRCAPLQCWDG